MKGFRDRVGALMPGSAWDLAPGLAAMRGYDRRGRLGTDLLAGLSVTAVAIPAGLGMGELAGVDPVAGLYATMFPLLAYAIIGSSRQLVVGPEGTLSSLTAVTIAPIAAGDPDLLLPLAAALALMAGAIQIASGALRLGFMAQFLSKPILIGYMNGVAGIIVIGQVGKLLGLDIESRGFFPQLWENLTEILGTHWPTLVLSAALLTVYFALRRLAPRVPAGLVTITAAGIASVALGLADHGVVVVGDVHAGLPVPAPPSIGFEHISQLAIPAAGLALVGFADAAAITHLYAKKHHYTVDDNRELIGLGAANVVSGLTHGVPVGSSGSRTAANDAAGGSSPVVSLVVVAGALAVALFATVLIEPLPKAALAVVIVGAAIALVDFGAIRRLRRVHDTEAGLAIAALVGVLALNVLGGLILAVALSAGVFVFRSIRPHDAVLGSVSDIDGYRDIAHHPEAKRVESIAVYRFDAPLYFPNARYFTERAAALAEPSTRWLVVNCEAINYIDASGIDALRDLRTELARRGTVLVLARARADMREVLDRTGLSEDLLVYRSVRAAVAAYRRAREAR